MNPDLYRQSLSPPICGSEFFIPQRQSHQKNLNLPTPFDHLSIMAPSHNVSLPEKMTYVSEAEPRVFVDEDNVDDFLSQGVADLREIKYPKGLKPRSTYKATTRSPLAALNVDCNCGDLSCQLCAFHRSPADTKPTSIKKTTTSSRTDSNEELRSRLSQQLYEQVDREIEWHIEHMSQRDSSMALEDLSKAWEELASFIPGNIEQLLSLGSIRNNQTTDLEDDWDVVEVDVTVQQIDNREIDNGWTGLADVFVLAIFAVDSISSRLLCWSSIFKLRML